MSSSRSKGASTSSGRRPPYKGVRCRSSGKWVSEIREPKKPTRIWLGTFATPEMAAIAYDVAALALKGREAELNFPNWAASLPVPASASSRDIQAAAASAAAAAGAAGDGLLWGKAGDRSGNHSAFVEGDDPAVVGDDGFVDEEMIFNMPNVIANMAEGMLLSPPHLDVSGDDHGSSEGGGSHSLWRFP